MTENMGTDKISFMSLFISGASLGAVLSWAEVFKTSSSYFFPNEQKGDNIKGKLEFQLIFAIFITIVILLLFEFIQKSKSKYDELKKEIAEKNEIIKLIKNQKATSFT